ncbi:MAG: hypoxanthine phosphoribosyltransferase [Proteobacteria bacterium]|nr:MAG: hypoxanthine phosphoribosyltransferase [Pseudomonadota bacterium]
MSARRGAAFSAARIAARVAVLGKEITRAYKGRRVDVVITLDRSFIFAADLVRQIAAPVVCHFVREEVRDVEQAGHERREVVFSARPELKGRDVLVLDAVLDSGVTQDFLLRRLGESQPRSLRLAVLLDKPARRRVALEPDYFGFRTASKELWVGYGLAAPNGAGRNERHLSAGNKGGRRWPAKTERAANTKLARGR